LNILVKHGIIHSKHRNNFTKSNLSIYFIIFFFKSIKKFWLESERIQKKMKIIKLHFDAFNFSDTEENLEDASVINRDNNDASGNTNNDNDSEK
jgi:hypothetical protein